MTTTTEQTLRLQTWLSPAFPIGGFSYSHGLEYAVEAGLVRDRATAQDWISAVLRHGSGRSDGMLLAAAYRAGDGEAAVEVASLAAALRGTAELARESVMQGAAFLAAVQAVWPSPVLEQWAMRLAEPSPPVMPGSGPGMTTKKAEPALPVVVGAVCRFAAIDLDLVVPLYLQAFAANLVSAAVRLVPLGQTDGLRIVAALEPAIAVLSTEVMHADLDDLGTATPMLDWCSMRHETQYTRLFRS